MSVIGATLAKAVDNSDYGGGPGGYCGAAVNDGITLGLEELVKELELDYVVEAVNGEALQRLGRVWAKDYVQIMSERANTAGNVYNHFFETQTFYPRNLDELRDLEGALLNAPVGTIVGYPQPVAAALGPTDSGAAGHIGVIMQKPDTGEKYLKADVAYYGSLINGGESDGVPFVYAGVPSFVTVLVPKDAGSSQYLDILSRGNFSEADFLQFVTANEAQDDYASALVRYSSLSEEDKFALARLEVIIAIQQSEAQRKQSESEGSSETSSVSRLEQVGGRWSERDIQAAEFRLSIMALQAQGILDNKGDSTVITPRTIKNPLSEEAFQELQRMDTECATPAEAANKVRPFYRSLVTGPSAPALAPS